MHSRIVTVFLALGLALSAVLLTTRLTGLRLPGDQQGYEPEQPIAFSHRLHAGDMEMSCLYCHAGAETSRHAGIPAASTCMNCHKFVTAPIGAVRAAEELAESEGRKPGPVVSTELKKLYDALALDAALQPVTSRGATPIAWTKVHNVPDFVYFDHRAHATAGVACQTCHGPVETMERVRQVPSLSMGWCVNCHRDANAQGVAGKPVKASLDCVTCHS